MNIEMCFALRSVSMAFDLKELQCLKYFPKITKHASTKSSFRLKKFVIDAVCLAENKPILINFCLTQNLNENYAKYN